MNSLDQQNPIEFKEHDQHVNLVVTTIELLKKHEHPAPEAWLVYLEERADNDPDYRVVQNLINRAFRQIIFDTPEDVVAFKEAQLYRCLLVDNIHPNEWLLLMDKKVLPWIAKHNLPRFPTKS